MKKAYLVEFYSIIRVIAETEDQAKEMALNEVRKNCKLHVGSGGTEVSEDLDCPYDPETSDSIIFSHPQLQSDFNAGLFTADQYTIYINKTYPPTGYLLIIQKVGADRYSPDYLYYTREEAETDMEAFLNRNQNRES